MPFIDKKYFCAFSVATPRQHSVSILKEISIIISMIVIYLSGTMVIREIWKIEIRYIIIFSSFTKSFWTFITQSKRCGQPPVVSLSNFVKTNGLLRSWTYSLQDPAQREKCIRSFFWSVFSCIRTVFNLQPTYFKRNTLTHWTALTLKQAAIVVYSPSDILLAAHICPWNWVY